jgi:hypothetical protein
VKSSIIIGVQVRFDGGGFEIFSQKISSRSRNSNWAYSLFHNGSASDAKSTFNFPSTPSVKSKFDQRLGVRDLVFMQILINGMANGRKYHRDRTIGMTFKRNSDENTVCEQNFALQVSNRDKPFI